jgi:hypothetical protein
MYIVVCVVQENILCEGYFGRRTFLGRIFLEKYILWEGYFGRRIFWEKDILWEGLL